MIVSRLPNVIRPDCFIRWGRVTSGSTNCLPARTGDALEALADVNATDEWRRYVLGTVNQIKDGECEGTALYRLVRKIGLPILCRKRRPQETPDLLHDIIVVILEAVLNDQVRRPDHLDAFLAGVAKNVACQHRKRQRRQSSLLESLEPIKSQVTVEDQLVRKQMLDVTRSLVLSLPKPFRQALIGLYVHGRSPKELCLVLNVTPARLRYLRLRGLKLLRHRWEGLGVHRRDALS